MEIAKAKVANALTSAASDHVIAVAADVYDETQEKYQNTINQEVEQRLGNLEQGTSGGGGSEGGGESFSGSASDVTYDNAESGLESTDVQQAVDELAAKKVDKDDNAPELTAGFANNLVGRGEATEESIGFRASGGDTSIEDGTARIERLKGNTVVWNQLGSAVSDKSVSGVTLTVKNDSFTLTGSATADGGFYNVGTTSMRVFLPDGHKGLFLLKHLSGTYTVNPLFSYGAVSLKEGESVIKTDSTNYKYLLIRFSAGDVFDNATFSFILHDLTQMFGAGNEPTTIDEFNARKPLGIDEYAYNEGELISTTADEIKSVGFNAWDEEWEVGAISGGNGSDQGGIQIRSKGYIRIIPNAEYQILCTSDENQGFIVVGYDENLNYIGWLVWQGGTRTFTTQSNARYIRFCTYAVEYGTTYKNDICIHLVHTGYRNGEYEPYKEFRRSLPISEIKDSDGNQLFPNGILSAGSVYDEITATKAIKRIDRLVLNGSEKWGLQSVNSYDIANFVIENNTFNLNYKGISDRFVTQSTGIADTQSEGIMYATAGNIYIRIKSTTASTVEQFKTWLSQNNTTVQGVLAEPIEVDLEEPINMDYEVSDFGTEEVISDTPTTLLNADIIYQFNAVDRIRDNSRHTEEAEVTLDNLQKGQLNLTVKDNGNIVLSNANGVSKEFMPATPSGDPMHYAYIAAGAEWNDTDTDITKTGIFGQSVVHKSKRYYLNDVGDLTADEINYIYTNIYGIYLLDKSRMFQNDNKLRTLFGTGVNVGQRIKNIGIYAFHNSGLVSAYWISPKFYSDVEPTIFNNISISDTNNTYEMFGKAKKLKYVQPLLCRDVTSNIKLFNGCSSLEEARMAWIKNTLLFSDSPNISKASILYSIQYAEPTTAITITLHADAYARLGEDADILAALEAKNTELSSTGGSISLVSA